jgi:hypothetical protein
VGRRLASLAALELLAGDRLPEFVDNFGRVSADRL